MLTDKPFQGDADIRRQQHIPMCARRAGQHRNNPMNGDQWKHCIAKASAVDNLEARVHGKLPSARNRKFQLANLTNHHYLTITLCPNGETLLVIAQRGGRVHGVGAH